MSETIQRERLAEIVDEAINEAKQGGRHWDSGSASSDVALRCADRITALRSPSLEREALAAFVALLDGQTEPLHPVSWLTVLERGKRALAGQEAAPRETVGEDERSWSDLRDDAMEPLGDDSAPPVPQGEGVERGG